MTSVDTSDKTVMAPDHMYIPGPVVLSQSSILGQTGLGMQCTELDYLEAPQVVDKNK